MLYRFLLAVALVFLSTNATIVRLDCGTGGVTAAFDVNSAGEVAGSFADAKGYAHAAMWLPSGICHPAPGDAEEARGISDSSVLTGVMHRARDGFVWDVSSGSLLNLTSYPYLGSRGYAINRTNDVAGMVEADAGIYKAAVFTAGGTVVGIGGLGGNQSIALAVADDAPVAAGQSTVDPARPWEIHGFVWMDGTIVDVGGFGGTDTRANGVVVDHWPDTSSVFVVGQSAPFSGADDYAFLWHDHILSRLPPLGSKYAAAYGINRRHDIVGWSKSLSGDHVAVIWPHATSPIDLNTLLPPGSGWVLNEARAINDSGAIAGIGQYRGVRKGFLLFP